VERYIQTHGIRKSKSLLHISKVYYLFPDLFDLLFPTWIFRSSFTVLISLISSVVCSFSFVGFFFTLFFLSLRSAIFIFCLALLCSLFFFVSFRSLLEPESFLKHFVVSLLFSEHLDFFYSFERYWLFFYCMISIFFWLRWCSRPSTSRFFQYWSQSYQYSAYIHYLQEK